MKEKMAEWAKANWGNLSEKSAKSVINRVIAVMEKNPSTLKGALVGLTQSLNALGSKEDTSEQDTGEIWFIAEFISNILLPIAEQIDAITKAKSASAPKKRVEIWADTQAEAQAQAQAQTPPKPSRKPRTEAQAPALAVDSEILKAFATLKSAGLI